MCKINVIYIDRTTISLVDVVIHSAAELIRSWGWPWPPQKIQFFYIIYIGNFLILKLYIIYIKNW